MYWLYCRQHHFTYHFLYSDVLETLPLNYVDLGDTFKVLLGCLHLFVYAVYTFCAWIYIEVDVIPHLIICNCRWKYSCIDFWTCATDNAKFLSATCISHSEWRSSFVTGYLGEASFTVRLNVVESVVCRIIQVVLLHIRWHNVGYMIMQHFFWRKNVGVLYWQLCITVRRNEIYFY